MLEKISLVLVDLFEALCLGVVFGVFAFEMQIVQHALQFALQERGERDTVAVNPFAAFDSLVCEVLGLDLLVVEAEGPADGGREPDLAVGGLLVEDPDAVGEIGEDENAGLRICGLVSDVFILLGLHGFSVWCLFDLTTSLSHQEQ